MFNSAVSLVTFHRKSLTHTHTTAWRCASSAPGNPVLVVHPRSDPSLWASCILLCMVQLGRRPRTRSTMAHHTHYHKHNPTTNTTRISLAVLSVATCVFCKSPSSCSVGKKYKRGPSFYFILFLQRSLLGSTCNKNATA
jgi:hypothetical protein